MTGRKKLSTTVYLDPLQVRKLSELREITAITVAEHIRRSVSVYLDGMYERGVLERPTLESLVADTEYVSMADVAKIVDAAVTRALAGVSPTGPRLVALPEKKP